MSTKAVAGSVLLAVIISSAIGLFALPLLYPIVYEDVSTIPGFTDGGIVLQSIYGEFTTTAQILDSDNDTYISVPDTKLNITIQSNSRIVSVYSSLYILGVSGSLSPSQRVGFNVSLGIEGIGKKTTRISYFETSAYPATREFSSTFYLNFVSAPLPAGSYTVALSWISIQDQDGLSYLLFNTPAANFTRSLWIQEYKT
ncbi:MAG: hypothetical protein ACFFE8_06590 [Candidatus Heimdallarchaeota archaeon]